MSIWLKRVLICASLAAGLLALGTVTAYADDHLVPAPEPGAVIDQTQTATNTNSTDQEANSEATTDQDNVNVQICVACVGSQNGDVNQSNDATTDSESTNNNATGQSIDQGQVASIGSGDSVPQDPQHQDAYNGNETGQEANSTATTDQKNVNGQVCALCVGSQNGDVNQTNEAYTGSEATNNNATAQGVGQDQAASITGGETPCGCDANHGGGAIT